MDRVKGKNRARRLLTAAVESLEPRVLMSAAHPVSSVRATPLSAPASLTVAAGMSGVQVKWTASASAAGYYVLRSDGKGFAQVAKISSPGTTSYTDAAVIPNHAYSYEVRAYSTTTTSAVSKTATVTTPVATPSGITATVLGPKSVQLKWTDNDKTATGYYVLRSTDGTHFAQLTKLTSSTASSFTDNTVLSGHLYDYEVQAFSGTKNSAVSGASVAITPLVAPTTLAASLSGSAVNLKWTDNDGYATAYLVLRSTNGSTFSQLAQISSGTATTFSDTTVAAGQTYYYEVKAQNSVASSGMSNSASVSTPSASSGGNVTIATRYGNELVITASGTADSVSITQGGSTLTIVADGQTYTDPAPMSGLFVYTRGGADSLSIDSSVTLRTTLDTIDGAATTISSAGTNVSAWIDSTDSFTGTGNLHSVAAFAGGVSKAAGASLADPTDGGATFKVNASLWGTGPVADDVNQGEIGDCYFLSTLAAFAGTSPARLQESAVDLGDGTFAVQFFSGGNATYVRVNNDFSSGPFAGYMYAHPGSTGTLWAEVMEKAWCYSRSGANTFKSIDGGWMGEVYTALNVNNSFFVPSNYSESAFYSMVSTALSGGKPVTVACLNGPNLVSDHAYTLVSASKDASGATHYVVRNPWGVSGDSLENSQGYATLTFSQFTANFAEGCLATS